MKQPHNDPPVIELNTVVNHPRITHDGYYPVVITDAKWVYPKTNQVYLQVRFQVSEGPCQGAWLQRRFYLTERSIRSLSYLCAAVSITGQLKDPDMLIGKILIALVNLKNALKKGVIVAEPVQFVPYENTHGGLNVNK